MPTSPGGLASLDQFHHLTKSRVMNENRSATVSGKAGLRVGKGVIKWS